MKKSSFKSGVHPFEGKAYSQDMKITELKPAEFMVFPMSQHIGAPAKPVVKVGDRVLKGMKIAKRLRSFQVLFTALFRAWLKQLRSAL